MTSCHNIDEQMSQKRDDQMSDEQLSHNHLNISGAIKEKIKIVSKSVLTLLVARGPPLSCFYDYLKKSLNPVIFVNLIYGHFDILMFQNGSAKKVAGFRAVLK